MKNNCYIFTTNRTTPCNERKHIYRFKKLSVGRVQTLTLAMLVDCQEKIRNFSKEAYYSAVLTAEGLSAESENMNDEAACDELVNGGQGKTAVVSKLKKTVGKSSPTKLYVLTTLQREVNWLFGYTTQGTLKELQELYEARMVTYPRTDSQYITSDMERLCMSCWKNCQLW